MPNDEDHRHKCMKMASKRWNGFKHDLTRYYVSGKKRLDKMFSDYPWIDQDTWDMFARSRQDGEFQVG